ncbi:hypothetical protein Pyn_00041 [Prunus yedoensis var. nudiflora]|uniref:Gnk2-homologous domain-containing protein n=1 Tax=Prunus yedoensis var. nudiflora TaxID=2094558 RepID=A0A314Z6N3_PRUYE|nr:hypothetical protein Pyn_00041 [Prunus yedoensis var. nudiflora]
MQRGCCRAAKTALVASKTPQSKSASAVRTRQMLEFGTTLLLESFNKELGALVDKIEAQAVVPKNGGLGKGETKLSPFLTLYALVQCTRDLSQLDCSQCLAIAVGNFPTFCDNRKGCRVLYSSCYVRYELYPFSSLLIQTIPACG